MSFNLALNPDETVVGTLPSDLTPAAHADLTWALALFAAKRPAYETAHAYYRGEHPLTLATDQYQESFRALLDGLNCNVCPLVVSAVTDRLKVTGFAEHASEGAGPRATTPDTTPPAPDPETVGDLAWGLWQDARLDRHANQVHVEAVRAGDAYLLVWEDVAHNNVPCFYPQYATDVVVRYDPERRDRIVLGAKLWAEQTGPLLMGQSQATHLRCTLYYPDRIERYRTRTATLTLPGASQAGLFEPFTEEGGRWPEPNPYGRVPLFHFAFGAGVGQYGTSALANVIPIQNALNKQLGDVVIASEFASYRQRVVMGAEPEQETDAAGVPRFDDAGRPVYRAVNGGMQRLLMFASVETKIGEFGSADLAQMVAVKDSYFGDVARVTGIPLHHLLLAGHYPSGQALKVAESRIVATVEHTQTDFGDVWEDALGFALRIAGLEGDPHITAKWQRPDSRDELQHAQTVAQMLLAGLSEEEALRLFDYTAAEVAQITAERRHEQAFAADVAAGDGSATLRAELPPPASGEAA